MRGTKAAMIFQEPSTALNPVFTVGWQLAEGLRAHGKYTKAQARAACDRDAPTRRHPRPRAAVDDYPHQFSGGQKQRIVIAMALALDPAVIIADEPTTALDVTVQAEILDLLRRLRDEDGTAIVLITHNMGVVADLADRVAVMSTARSSRRRRVQELFAPRSTSTPRSSSPPCRAWRSPTVSCPKEPPLPSRSSSRDGPRDRVPGPARPARPSAPSTRSSFTIAPGRGARPGRRERLGQDDDRPRHRRAHSRSPAGRCGCSAPRCSASRSASSSAQRKELGFVFQDPATSFNPLLTIAQSVAEPLIVHTRRARHRGRARPGRRAARGGAAAQGVRRPVPARALAAASASAPRSPARSPSTRSC